ncbi:MAG: hypothetical protein U9R15_10645 [Chloroflexota bacterium]|nr:hypothetical protein [Chloroflexota bacterium]
MKNFGRTSVHEFLGDFVVYRNLAPLDPRLPSLAEIRQQVGLPEDVIPRKSQPAYARVMAYLLQQARALDAPDAPIKRLVYVGDTRMNDGAAFANICRAGKWPGLAFIVSERDEPAHVEIVEQKAGTLYLANRWAAIFDFEKFCRERDFPLDVHTAAVIDLDKTAFGARGRNDHVIDRARVEAVRHTVGDLLGDDFDPECFQAAYDRLNQAEFHLFTADNQDYVAYICLILGARLYQLEAVVADVQAGQMSSFEQFIAEVDGRADELSLSLREIHERVYSRVQGGDPTPFKAFRYNEYISTVERMGFLDGDAPAVELLEQEIVITQEVRETALAWRERGVLLFGLSDKPDEASAPSDELAAHGYQAIHRVETHAVGE